MKKIMKFGLIWFVSTMLVGCSGFKGKDNSISSNQGSEGQQLGSTNNSEGIRSDNSSNDNPLTPPNKITVTLDAAGGNVSEMTKEITTGGSFTLPIPSKKGYIFKGWYDGSTKVTDSSGKSIIVWSSSDNVTFRAEYELRKIKLVFVFEGNEVIAKDYDITIDLMSFLETDVKTSVPYWGWYKDSEQREFVRSFDDLIIENETAKVFGKKADGFTIENGVLTKANSSKVSGEVDLRCLFFGGKRITSIGDKAFMQCDSLTSVAIPEGVTSIGNLAFIYCGSLNNVSLPQSLLTIGKEAFRFCSSLESIVIPNGIKRIEYCLFSGCDSLTSVKLPDTVTYIAERAFYNCPFTTIHLPQGLETIFDGVFQNCKNLTSINIPDSVKTISHYAFSGCSSLQTIIIPKSVVKMGMEVFIKCENLSIKCEIDKKPESGWDYSWNADERPVQWSYKG